MGFWEDAKYIASQDPAATGPWQVFFMYPGYHAVRWHRISHWLHVHKMRTLARGISQFARFDQTSNCSTAAALKVSAAATITFFPSL